MRTARASGWARRRPIAALEPSTMTGLGTAEQLVAAEGHQVDPQAQRLARRGLLGQQRQVGQRAAAEVVDDQRVALVGEAHELLDGGWAVKPTIR